MILASHALPRPAANPFERETQENATRTEFPALHGTIAVPLRLSAKSCRVPPGSFGHQPFRVLQDEFGYLANFLHVFSLSVAAVHEPNMDQELRRDHGNLTHKRGGASAHV